MRAQYVSAESAGQSENGECGVDKERYGDLSPTIAAQPLQWEGAPRFGFGVPQHRPPVVFVAKSEYWDAFLGQSR